MIMIMIERMIIVMIMNWTIMLKTHQRVSPPPSDCGRWASHDYDGGDDDDNDDDGNDNDDIDDDKDDNGKESNENIHQRVSPPPGDCGRGTSTSFASQGQ